MSLFPAVRKAGTGPIAQQQQQAPSVSRTSVLRAQAQSQQQQQQQQGSQPSLTQQSLPRISHSGSGKKLREPILPSVDFSSPDSLSSSPPPAAVASSKASQKALQASFAHFASPSSSGAPINSLRVTDARLATAPAGSSASSHGSAGDGELDHASLWAALQLEELNAFLASPTLSPAEQALNGTRLPRDRASQELATAVSRAHQALDVSKLPGVRHFPAQLGVSEVGGQAKVLFLQIENTPQEGSTPPPNPTGVQSALQAPAGTLSWRVRMPCDLDVAVEHWAAIGGSDGGVSGPTDEVRYHQSLADRGIFSLRPRGGTLAPGESTLVEIVYFPKFVGKHVLPLLFQTRGGKHFTIVLHAETVERRAGVFSMHHLPQAASEEQNGGSSKKQLKAPEESKQSSDALIFVNPFLPPAQEPSYSFALADMPLGLSANQVPEQVFPLFNQSRSPLRYRVLLRSLRSLARANHDVDVLSIAPSASSPGGGVQFDPFGEEFISGIVGPGERGGIRFRFRPLELKEYSCEIRILVVEGSTSGAQSEAEEEDEWSRAAVHSVLFKGRGVLPREFALAPFPPQSTMPRAQTLLLPGQLAVLSEDVVQFGDLPPHARASRVLTLKNLCNEEGIEFAFLHRLRLRKDKWSRIIAQDHRVRSLLQGGGADEGFEDDNDEDESGVDEQETVHVTFFPSRGMLGPGESVQVRVDLFAGAQPRILLGDVQVHVRVAQDGVIGGEFGFGATTNGSSFGATHQSFGATAHSTLSANNAPIDEYGYNRTPSLRLGARTPISSSTPGPRGQKGLHRDPRTGRLVHSLIGVGVGAGGLDVRVDYPPAPQLPLNVSSLARRAAGMRAGLGDEAQRRLQEQEGVATAHLAPTMAALNSVPARATWFADATAPISEMSAATYNRLALLVQARVLGEDLLESHARERSEAFGAQQSERDRLPQQLLTEIVHPTSTVQQRYFVAQVDAPQPPSSSTEEKLPADAKAVAVVEEELLKLLRQTLAQTAVTESFTHLRREPIPFFTDLLAAQYGQKPASSAAVSAAVLPAEVDPSASLVDAPAALQNLSEAILNDTLLKLTIEALQPEHSGFQLEATPKLFLHAPPAQR